MASSRICVKNLPKHLTDDAFRLHFAQKGTVTDAKILRTKDGRSRQIGFIGYKTEKEAQEAAQYFDRTYLHTSKLSVELAKPVGDKNLARPWSKYSQGSSANLKRKQLETPSTESNQKKKKQKPAEPQPQPQTQNQTVPVEAAESDDVGKSGRLFLRNLSFEVEEDDIVQLFKKYGEIAEVHIPLNTETKSPKGIAFVRFSSPPDAIRAMSALDGKIFQGRLLHILPATEAPQEAKQSNGKEKKFKDKKLDELKAKSNNDYNWNSLFMRSDAVAESIAERYNIPKDKLLDRESDNMAVRLALAETQIINETKKMLEEEGVCLDTLGHQNDKSFKRSNTVILVKNIPFKTELHELQNLFAKFGTLVRVVLPPARTIALVEFSEPNEAKKAFRELAYKKFKHVPLFLEWAPMNIFKPKEKMNGNQPTVTNQQEKKENEETTPAPVVIKETVMDDVVDDESVTIYVKNLNFSTTDEQLAKFFSEAGQVRSAIVSKKKDMKNPNQMLSMGYGFVEFYKKEDAIKAMKNLQGKVLDNHALVLKLSTQTKKEEKKKKTQNTSLPQTSKIIIRNLPFEATKKDLQQLCKPFGQVKSVRIPKKFDGKSRGFAFVEFLTKQEAQNAFEALTHSHLYGRHLVLEYSQDESGIEAARQKTIRYFSQQ